MKNHEDRVRIFCDVIWNHRDKSVVPDVIHESFAFRGSLGVEKRGHSGFGEYLDMVHDALSDYECVIIESDSDSSKVFARMRFSGVHQGTFLGVKGTGKRITWDGAALFHFKDDLISDLWVLADLKSIDDQLPPS